MQEEKLRSNKKSISKFTSGDNYDRVNRSADLLSYQVSLDVTPPKCIPPPLSHSHIYTHMTLTFDLRP